MKTNTDASPMSGLIGMGEKEISELAEMALRFFQSYSEKSAGVSDQTWLAEKLSEEMPEYSLEETKILVEKITADIEAFDQALASLEETCEQGQSKEEWFRDQSQLAAIGMNVNDYGNKLANIDRALFMTNCQLLRLLAAQEEKCPQHFTLDSFIAEQLHVISFNAHAAEANSPYRAEIFVPTFEQGYDAGTPDVIIKDTQTGKKVLSYRVKFGGKEEISNLTQNDNANVPCIVVATEQLEEMRTAFPKHVFTDRIGDTEKISLMSDTLAKKNVWEQKTLELYPIERDDWNSYNTRELALHLGRNTSLTGAVETMLIQEFSPLQQLLQHSKTFPKENGNSNLVGKRERSFMAILLACAVIKKMSPMQECFIVDIANRISAGIGVLEKYYGGEFTELKLLDAEKCLMLVAMHKCLKKNEKISLNLFPMIWLLLSSLIKNKKNKTKPNAVGIHFKKLEKKKNFIQTALTEIFYDIKIEGMRIVWHGGERIKMIYVAPHPLNHHVCEIDSIGSFMCQCACITDPETYRYKKCFTSEKPSPKGLKIIWVPVPSKTLYDYLLKKIPCSMEDITKDIFHSIPLLSESCDKKQKKYWKEVILSVDNELKSTKYGTLQPFNHYLVLDALKFHYPENLFSILCTNNQYMFTVTV